ncbi:hypothetical protein SPONN_2809 [uncultured Candidatus Thioglobus sp.]|nr:hypothetical protein SPONN_2809 [uncultured Candidatus Thioglobus sp.]
MKQSKQENNIYDKEFQKKLIEDPSIVAKLWGYPDDTDVTFTVKKNTKDTIYVVIPSNQTDISLSDIADLNAAANTASTLGTAGSASTASSAFSCAGTLSTVGSAGSIGTVKT